MTRSDSRTPRLPLLAIAAVGLVLRIAAARGGLWLDEAWSAAFAADVGTPIGVFLNIHHDNNHHLNTLWLQLVGIDASPVVQRALSIASGTAAIFVAGLILAPKGRVAAMIAATLFAVSPILVTYGSEARGYAPMLLAFLALVLIVGRWLAEPARPTPALGLAALCLVGTLAQMTFVFGVCAVAGWAMLRRRQVGGVRSAAFDTARLMAAPIAVTLVTIMAITRWLPGPGGFTIGSFFPFTATDLAIGQSDMLTYTLGLPALPAWLILPIAIALVGVALLILSNERRALCLLAIVGVPAGCAVIQLGNVAIPRYFLVGSACLLLLLAEALAATLARTILPRAIAMICLAAILIGSGWRDVQLLTDRRADPALAVAEMQRRSPEGSTVTLDRQRAVPVIRVAAAQQRYQAQIVPCGRFLFVDRDGAEPFPSAPRLCGKSYRPIAAAHPTGLSGTHWTLYERRP